MIEFLQNPWVCGIGGGIISGIIVFYITKWIMGKKDNSVYLRQVDSANSEVISILKPYIADNGLPTEDVMFAIMSSVARKYQVQVSDMYEINVFCEELIKQIVENVYVSSDKKREYAHQLVEYIKNLNIGNNKNREVIKEIIIRKDMGDKYRTLLSLTLALSTLIITCLSIVYTVMDENKFNTVFNKEWNILLIVMITTMIMMVVPLMLSVFIKELRKRHTYKDDNEVVNQKEEKIISDKKEDLK